MKKIPLIKPDLPAFRDVEGPFREALENGRITNFGKYVAQFEEEAGKYLGTHVATVSSGTQGLIFTLQSFGLQKSQKVILPSFSFVATAQAILYAGGIPLFAEIEGDLTMSPSDLEVLLAKHGDVTAVLPVHTYGLPCRVGEIQSVVEHARKKRGHLIHLFYDAAHAFGSSLGGKRIGTFWEAEVFSLSVTKALVCVEGGLVSSSDPKLIHRIRKMRNYGIEENYNAHWPGMNGKMSEFHAIVGLKNLERLPEILSARAKKAAFYKRQIEEKTPFRTIPVPSNVTHTFKDFTIVVPPEMKGRRDAIIQFLADRGIETRAYFYPPIHEQKFFRRFATRPLPLTEDLSRRVITLPFFTRISEPEMEEVAVALQEAERSLG